jgi:hypothetical protein
LLFFDKALKGALIDDGPNAVDVPGVDLHILILPSQSG